MQIDSEDASNPGRMCLKCLGSLEADEHPDVRRSAGLPVHPGFRAERHIPTIRSGPYRPVSATARGFEESTFAQYIAHISADPEDVHQQAVSSAFSQYSKDTVVPPEGRQRKVHRVPSYGVLARFLPKFDRGSRKQGDENGVGSGKKTRKTKLRKFFRKFRNRMSKKQQTHTANKKDSVMEPLKILNGSNDLSAVSASQSVEVTVESWI